MSCVLQPCVDKGGERIRLTQKGRDRIIECSEIKQDGVKDNI